MMWYQSPRGAGFRSFLLSTVGILPKTRASGLTLWKLPSLWQKPPKAAEIGPRHKRRHWWRVDCNRHSIPANSPGPTAQARQLRLAPGTVLRTIPDRTDEWRRESDSNEWLPLPSPNGVHWRQLTRKAVIGPSVHPARNCDAPKGFVRSHLMFSSRLAQ